MGRTGKTTFKSQTLERVVALDEFRLNGGKAVTVIPCLGRAAELPAKQAAQMRWTDPRIASKLGKSALPAGNLHLIKCVRQGRVQVHGTSPSKTFMIDICIFER